MHELALMAGLIRRIESVVREADAARATGVTLRIGRLAHLSPGHLRGHFARAARGTLAEGAVLRIETGGEDDPYALDVVLASVDVEG